MKIFLDMPIWLYFDNNCTYYYILILAKQGKKNKTKDIVKSLFNVKTTTVFIQYNTNLIIHVHKCSYNACHAA